jgi:ADP-ribose pyrophosphatase YjhB (NUDIX family)
VSDRPVWTPHVTVAAVIERDGRYLMVEEATSQGIRINQPAGHLEANESLLAACARETLEETAHEFTPDALIGVYRWNSNSTPYLRFAFAGVLGLKHEDRSLDTGILRAVWLDYADLCGSKAQHRSPLVMRCVDDYRSGRRVSLELLCHLGDEGA